MILLTPMLQNCFLYLPERPITCITFFIFKQWEKLLGHFFVKKINIIESIKMLDVAKLKIIFFDWIYCWIRWPNYFLT